MAQDGFIDPVDFDDKDRFCLNGERLMVINGEYGADASVYFTEQNSFQKVVSYGSAGSGPASFKVWNKAGLIMEFGVTADARIEAAEREDVLVWALNKIQDTKGNYFSVYYSEDNAKGEYLPKRIDYTGNAVAGLNPFASVQFFYEKRPDSVPSYVGGSLVQSTQRLTRIETWEGADIFRKYFRNEWIRGVDLYKAIITQEIKVFLQNKVSVVIAFHGMGNVSSKIKTNIKIMFTSICQPTLVHCLNLDNELNKHSKIFLKDKHWNNLGHQIVADKIIDFIKNNTNHKNHSSK